MMQTYIGSYWYHFSEQVPICKYFTPYILLANTNDRFSAQANIFAR
jgi:hypothetical protein